MDLLIVDEAGNVPEVDAPVICAACCPKNILCIGDPDQLEPFTRRKKQIAINNGLVPESEPSACNTACTQTFVILFPRSRTRESSLQIRTRGSLDVRLSVILSSSCPRTKTLECQAMGHDVQITLKRRQPWSCLS